MEGTALFFALAFSAVVNFSYLANGKAYKTAKYLTAFFLVIVGLFFLETYESLSAIYWLFTGIMLLISGAMNREKRGEKVFRLPTLPSFKRGKKSKAKKQYKNVEKNEYADSDSDTQIQKRERLIEQLQKENEKLRRNTHNVDDLDDWEQLRKKKLG